MKNLLKAVLSIITFFLSVCLFANCTGSETSKEKFSFVFASDMRTTYSPMFAMFEGCTETEAKFLVLPMNQYVTFSLADIDPKYLSDLREGNVALMIDGKAVSSAVYPVVIQKSSQSKGVDPKMDSRKFMATCIMKDENAFEKDIYYSISYMSLLGYGFTEPGRKMFENGSFFFSEKDFDIEFNEKPFPGGKYSVVKKLNGQFGLCQTVFKGNELILRLDDGNTFRYPLGIFQEHMLERVKNEIVTAITLEESDERWGLRPFAIPAFISSPSSSYSKSSLLDYNYASQHHYRPDVDKYISSLGLDGILTWYTEEGCFFTAEQVENAKKEINSIE